MLSKVREEEEGDSDHGESSTIKVGEGKRKEVLDDENVSLHYTREVRNVMTIILSREAHLVKDCKEALKFWKKTSPYRDVPSPVGCKWPGKVPTKHP